MRGKIEESGKDVVYEIKCYIRDSIKKGKRLGLKYFDIKITNKRMIQEILKSKIAFQDKYKVEVEYNDWNGHFFKYRQKPRKKYTRRIQK